MKTDCKGLDGRTDKEGYSVDVLYFMDILDYKVTALANASCILKSNNLRKKNERQSEKSI